MPASEVEVDHFFHDQSAGDHHDRANDENDVTGPFGEKQRYIAGAKYRQNPNDK
jgi:hypothetical protein